MTVAVDQEEEMTEFGSDKLQVNPSDYGCQILQEKTTLEAANDKSLPNDARLVWYVVGGVEYIDLTRCRKTVELFDMYYDRYGKGAVQKIDFGLVKCKSQIVGVQIKRKRKEKKMNEDDLKESN